MLLVVACKPYILVCLATFLIMSMCYIAALFFPLAY